jgi:hypothetical protein
MFPSTACSLLACVALLLATAGCVADTVAAADRPSAVSAMLTTPDAGHELHRLFDAEKRNATVVELPAQF